MTDVLIVNEYYQMVKFKHENFVQNEPFIQRERVLIVLWKLVTCAQLALGLLFLRSAHVDRMAHRMA